MTSTCPPPPLSAGPFGPRRLIENSRVERACGGFSFSFMDSRIWSPFVILFLMWIEPPEGVGPPRFFARRLLLNLLPPLNHFFPPFPSGICLCPCWSLSDCFPPVCGRTYNLVFPPLSFRLLSSVAAQSLPGNFFFLPGRFLVLGFFFQRWFPDDHDPLCSLSANFFPLNLFFPLLSRSVGVVVDPPQRSPFQKWVTVFESLLVPRPRNPIDPICSPPRTVWLMFFQIRAVPSSGSLHQPLLASLPRSARPSITLTLSPGRTTSSSSIEIK